MYTEHIKEDQMKKFIKINMVDKPFNKGQYQVHLTRLKWYLIPPDFKEYYIRYS